MNDFVSSWNVLNMICLFILTINLGLDIASLLCIILLIMICVWGRLSLTTWLSVIKLILIKKKKNYSYFENETMFSDMKENKKKLIEDIQIPIYFCDVMGD